MSRRLILLSVIFLSCGESDEEKLQNALNEVERLRLLKLKTQEIILEQEANLRKETLAASDYSLEYKRKTSALEQKLRYWKNWHINNHKKKLQTEKRNLTRYENVLREIKIELWKASIEYNKHLRRHERFSHVSKPEPVDSVKYQNNITLTQTIIDSLQRVVSRLEDSKPSTEEIKDLERSPTQDSISISKKRLEDAIRFLSEEYEKHLNSSLVQIKKCKKICELLKLSMIVLQISIRMQ